MKFPGHIGKHLSRRQLFAHAESLAGAGGPVSAAHGGHVAKCKRCADEVTAIRDSLEFTAAADALEASEEMTQQILAKARRARREASPMRHRWAGRARMGFRMAAYAAGVAVVALLAFAAALGNPEAAEDSRAQQAVVRDAGATSQDIGKTATEVQALSSAVLLSAEPPRTPEEHKHLREVSAMDQDISAAVAALKRNPGCSRATHIVHANLRRQAETLRSLYTERKL